MCGCQNYLAIIMLLLNKFSIDDNYPLTPKSDWYLISPFKITPKSNINIKKNQENDHKQINSWLFNKFSLSAPQEMYREQYGEYAHWF